MAGSQLDSLDALLGTPAAAPPPAESPAEQQQQQQQQQDEGQAAEEGWYWWDRPAGRQTDPLRRKGMEVRELGWAGPLHAAVPARCR